MVFPPKTGFQLLGRQKQVSQFRVAKKTFPFAKDESRQIIFGAPKFLSDGFLSGLPDGLF
jgi:hypothetical protein